MISAPETYGLDVEQTLLFRETTPPPPDFAVYWADFRGELQAQSAAFTTPPKDSVNRVVFTSLRSVRVVGRLSLPELRPRGIVITSHGYENVPEIFADETEPWSEIGLGTLRVRVRGYPPSVQDVPDLRGAWIMRNIESKDSWIARGAVADLIQGYRALLRQFGPEMPIMFHGESFGGGLSIIAAAQLAQMNDAPARMAIGLPSFAAWEWRRGRYCAGAGAQVNMAIEGMRAEDEVIMRTLRLFDALHHAPFLTMPMVEKVAANDDVVPAPTQSAVFHALPEGNKHRFVTRYGHFDGGISDLRRHALFERMHVAFLDPANDPSAVIAEYADRMELPPSQARSLPS